MRRLLPLPLALGLLAAPAHGATVSVKRESLRNPGAPGTNDTVAFEARYDRNDARITPLDDGTVLVTDAATPPVAGPGCAAVDPATVRCTAPGGRFDGVTIRLGLGAPNRLIVEGDLDATARGGPFDDVIQGGGGDDRIRGGGGADTLLGGAGNDRFVDDEVFTHRQDDRVDGGPGRDTISYAFRTSPVRVDLAAHVGGSRPERDRLDNLENVVGGKDDDRLAGDGGRNRIQGLNGRDTLIGRGGHDVLLGGKGRDRLNGGPGRDRLRGGRGRDRVIQ